MTRDMISIAEILELDRPPNTGDGAVVSSVRNWFQNTSMLYIRSLIGLEFYF